jgi:hypothetical protein
MCHASQYSRQEALNDGRRSTSSLHIAMVTVKASFNHDTFVRAVCRVVVVVLVLVLVVFTDAHCLSLLLNLPAQALSHVPMSSAALTHNTRVCKV